MAEVYAGFSEYTDAQVGRIIDYLEETGQLENTLDLLLRRQRRLRRGQPERLGQREQVLQRLSRRAAENLKISTSSAARTPTTTTRPAGRWPSPRRSRCSSGTPYSGRHLRSAGHLLAEGHQGQRRGAPPVPPLDRHRADHPRRASGSRCPKVYRGVEQYPLSGVSMRYTLRRTPTRRRRRSASTTRCSAPAASGRTAGRPPPSTRPITGKGHFDQDAWQLYHVDVDRSRVDTTSAKSIPRSSRS